MTTKPGQQSPYHEGNGYAGNSPAKHGNELQLAINANGVREHLLQCLGGCMVG